MVYCDPVRVVTANGLGVVGMAECDDSRLRRETIPDAQQTSKTAQHNLQADVRTKWTGASGIDCLAFPNRNVGFRKSWRKVSVLLKVLTDSPTHELYS